MPTAESTSMAGVSAWAYLATFICAVTRERVPAAKRSASRSSSPKARTSRAAARFSLKMLVTEPRWACNWWARRSTFRPT